MRLRDLLFLGVLLPTFAANAQSYVPFPTDSAEWMVQRYVFVTGSQSTISYSTYRLHGDTLVNDTLYHLLHESLGMNPSTSTLVAGFREEDRRVYARRLGDAGLPSDCQWSPGFEVLLYDFNLDEPGDSLVIQHPWLGEVILIVNNIDSVQVDGSYSRRLNCISEANSCGPMPFSYIEGVGSFGHPMDPFMLQDYEHFFVLSCFKTDGVFRYSSLQTPVCDWATVGIDPAEWAPSPALTARLAVGELLVSCPDADGVRLIDGLGRIVEDVPMRNGQVAIPVIEHIGPLLVQGLQRGRPFGQCVRVSLAR